MIVVASLLVAAAPSFAGDYKMLYKDIRDGSLGSRYFTANSDLEALNDANEWCRTMSNPCQVVSVERG